MCVNSFKGYTISVHDLLCSRRKSSQQDIQSWFAELREPYTRMTTCSIYIKFCCVQFTALWIFLNCCLFQVVGDADTSLPKLMDELGLYLKHFCCCCWLPIACMCCLNKNVSVSMTIMLWQKITFTQEIKKRFCCIFTLHSFSFRYSFVKVRDADEYQTIT